uniref:Uncharacterized protein n=1 Tax=Chromera velia CCMP2878 TaxID=1169474 RepID=A0A0G4GB70_9ALVE|eukprot:Cvel_21034.t1-p1 / transcript=Cvel_21034.t1 / gene=Cvel_21034 / organism=Chromera_velia_CCMP2878 / gene_product=Netrin receptor UNC5B, putative / transcript_product=Netrin receptor UNC5B, putative / location=Cvel_scaffold1940:18770-19936(-) / protein_length=389 / sequence_SO=supercontig / SO=protein_coding / is_pseudo=false
MLTTLWLSVFVSLAVTSHSQSSEPLTVTEWSAWSPCEVSCGEGQQHRTRRCQSEALDDCAQKLLESRPCRALPCPVDGGLSHWSGWSPCVVTVGDCTGDVDVPLRHRTRDCTMPPPSNGGRGCEGHLLEEEKCPVDALKCGRKKHHTDTVRASVGLPFFFGSEEETTAAVRRLTETTDGGSEGHGDFVTSMFDDLSACFWRGGDRAACSEAGFKTVVRTGGEGLMWVAMTASSPDEGKTYDLEASRTMYDGRTILDEVFEERVGLALGFPLERMDAMVGENANGNVLGVVGCVATKEEPVSKIMRDLVANRTDLEALELYLAHTDGSVSAADFLVTASEAYGSSPYNVSDKLASWEAPEGYGQSGGTRVRVGVWGGVVMAFVLWASAHL